ncbi:RNA polymerase B [Allomyces arbusculus]|nr:RNA polymerase B [Allomyces arbusculus]
MHSARLLKSRRGIVEVESVENDIQLGEEFQDARCLTVAEVHHYLAERRKTRGGAGASGADGGAYGAVPAAPAGPVLQASDAQTLNKMAQYCEQFSQFNSPAMVVEVRKTIEEFAGLDLFEFEMAQIANFLCDSVEEMRTLVPSLARVDETQLQELLHRLANIRKFAA